MDAWPRVTMIFIVILGTVVVFEWVRALRRIGPLHCERFKPQIRAAVEGDEFWWQDR